MEEYRTTKEECESKIKGVCEGCGGKLTAMETVDNSGHPTFWVGCEHCCCFRHGVDRRYWEIARLLVERGDFLPYHHLSRCDFEDTPEKLEYWFDTQCVGLAVRLEFLRKLFKEKFGVDKI